MAAIDPIKVLAHNRAENVTWVAGQNEFFEGMTFQDAKKLMGARLDLSDEEKSMQPTKSFDHIRDEDIPDSFDAREQWPGLIGAIRNQERCGSCWAFGAVESLADRFAIATNGKVNVTLSPEDLVSCDDLSFGCKGGLVNLAWLYLEEHGVVTETCMEYLAGDGRPIQCPKDWEHATRCPDSGEKPIRYKAKNYYRLSTVADIQKAIMTGGPVEAGFLVYQSFFGYKEGVYQRAWWDFGDLLAGGHAVKIVGWGVDNSVPYWLIANSWGDYWGNLHGYFKIKRGVNECFIEESVYAGDALV
ncbi:cathepsin B cysteine protease [Chloropicon primus]|uniref:Cathepsin B cysteine protease n=1 Tax=Chloropicon primus TaxID=1764295 RepID=A0A5B8MQM7_9CHLO|nr:cathepsin B cysteine protease [Chloropicon primus]UPR02000.1 cathepsin B cysteine protease [Chloropicon primus]|eukprot:QDZ22776.1 cathepsin B cysteine protease [Chloropicon primus]